MKPRIIKIVINKAKATIQYNGKLGFNMDAIELIDFKNKTSFFFAEDEDDEDVLYLIPATDEDGDVKISRSGDYYYLNLGDAMKKLGYLYEEYTIMFEVEKSSHDGKEIFVLKNRRSIKRREKDNDDKKEDR